MVEQHVEVTTVPLRRVRRPRALDAARHAVASNAALRLVDPAEPLLLEVGRFGIRPQQARIAIAVAFTDRVAAGGQGDGFLVVHCHALERYAYVMGRLQRIGLAVDAFRIHVDQAHHHSGQRVFQITFAGITTALTAARSEPFLLRAPVRVRFRMPDVLPAKRESVGLQAHRLVGYRAGEQDQIRPADPVAVFLLDRPQQATRLVEVDVIGPRVDRGKALITLATTTAAIGDAISAR